jgi:hypothetical protein
LEPVVLIALWLFEMRGQGMQTPKKILNDPKEIPKT